jgi:adenylate cyclase
VPTATNRADLWLWRVNLSPKHFRSCQWVRGIRGWGALGALNSNREISAGVTGPERRLAAIMFTDMVGYSALAQSDEATALAVLDQHNRLLRPVFSRFHGREVKTVGDAFLVEFDSALDSARCALEVQRVLHEYNLTAAEAWKIRIRIGIHVGDVVQEDGDVLGDAVNIASRIQSLAEAGGISLTQQVYDQIQNKISAPLVRLPPVVLKNIQVPMSVYRVVQSWDAAVPVTPTIAPTTGRSLAVLPLANISPDPHDEYFADGLTEELISVLSQVRDLSVIARTSVAPYKLAPKPVAQVGAELGVNTVLEGSVRKSGNRIRITLQLIDVPTQRHIWATSYNREIDDVFAVQADIAERTADALRLEISRAGGPRGGGRPTANPEAYDLFLRGLVYASQASGSGLGEAARSFERATELDPTFSEAYAAWANMYVRAMGDYLPMREVGPKARELAARALELDPDSSDAHATLGNIAFQFDHDWQRAEEEFRRAIAINPSNLNAYRFLGLMLVSLERLDEAREILRVAIRLDPGGIHQTMLAMADAAAGDYDEAIDYMERERDQFNSPVAAHVYLGFVYLTAGRRADAIKEADTPIGDADDVVRSDHALLNALVGRPEASQRVVAAAERGERRPYLSATDLATHYAAQGNKAKALDLLELDARDGDQTLWLWYQGVWFDGIRDDPRFVALLRHYGLPLHPAHPRPSRVTPA